METEITTKKEIDIGSLLALSEEEIFEKLASRSSGLTQAEAQERLTQYGSNELAKPQARSSVGRFLDQFKSPLIYVLLISAIIIWFLHEYRDSLIILAVLLINAVIGTIQEGKAEQTLEALKDFSQTDTRVVRDNQEMIIPDTELVPGDMIILGEGDKIPCDAYLVSARYLKTNEAALSGESALVEKHAGADNSYTDPTKSPRIVFKGSLVAGGSGRAVCCATGLATVIGSISQELSHIDSDVPLKKSIDILARYMTIIILLSVVVIFAVGLFLGNGARDMFLTAVAVAISVIPEGLPIVITLVLAAGVYRMGKRNALVKRLQAVEALGRADIIAVDKTGTITKNELVLKQIYMSDKVYTVTGDGYEHTGEVYLAGNQVSVPENQDMLTAGRIAMLSSRASVFRDEKSGTWKVYGDPTEAALSVFGQKVGFDALVLEDEHTLVSEIPFSSELGFHALLHTDDKEYTATIVGAPEKIISMCHSLWRDGKVVVLDDMERDILLGKLKTMAKDGLRVIAFASAPVNTEVITAEQLPQNLVLFGLWGIEDVMREGVAESVEIARKQGIEVVMITGDHRDTAKAIATHAGIYTPGSRIVTGDMIDTMSAEELTDCLADTTVFARVRPDHKLRIVEGYKKMGKIVAMTGDGVNDALSLAAADLGIAMGKIGTEVTKEAADIVLLDDNFKSILAAIEEGRRIFSSIRKVVLYLISTGVAELFVVMFALFMLLPLPLLPSQIIWLNLVTDTFLVIAYAMEPAVRLSSFYSKPTSPKIVNGHMIMRVMLLGLTMCAGTLWIFLQYQDEGLDKARTMALTVLAAFQWFNAWNVRSNHRSIFAMNPLKNSFLFFSTLLVIGAQLLLIYTPTLQYVFRTVALSPADWIVVVLVTSLVVVVEEIRKGVSYIEFRAVPQRRYVE